MFEGLLKRLLDTYLAPYVDGITQNLQLAVWSGNVVLENLTLKRDITKILALPFQVLFGKVGRISLSVPWASLGTTPIRIVVDSVYICIRSRRDERTDDELLEHVRLSKEKMISLLEREYAEFASSLKANGDVSSSYFIRLSQKILNNIQIDFTNIHLRCCDAIHSFGFKIDSISVRKSKNEDNLDRLKVETNDETKEEPITHICSLLGFSIYESGDPNLHYNEYVKDYTFNQETSGDFSDKGENVYVDDGASGSGPSGFFFVGSEASIMDEPLSRRLSSSLVTNMLIEQLSFTLLLAINAKNKSIFASLRIGATNPLTSITDKNESFRIVLSLDSIRAFMTIWDDMKFETERSQRLMMEKASTVVLDAEGIKGATKAEYIGLYTRKQNSLKSGCDPLTSQEEDRLRILTDVVPARHIARWRFACRKLKGSVKAETATVPANQATWFGWIKGLASSVGKSAVLPNKDSSDKSSVNFVPNLDLTQSLPGGLVLTEDELKLIKEAMTLDELFEDSMATSTYYLECVLPRFRYLIDAGKGETDCDDILSIEMDDLQSRLYLCAAVDTNDRDTYEGYFYINLDRFDVKFRETKIMTFISETYAEPVTTLGDIKEIQAFRDLESTENSAMNLRILHKVTNKGNMLVVNGKLKPMEAHVIPAIVSELMEMFVYVQPQRYSSFMPSQIVLTTSDTLFGKISPSETSNIDPSIIDDDGLLNPDKQVCKTAVDHLPALFAFDIKFAAPILLLYAEEYDRIDVHFGTLELKSNGACPISQMSGIIELKETQVSCLHHLHNDHKWFDILRPLPVKIHYNCDFFTRNMAFDILFEDVFVRSTPLATEILLKIPAELTKCLMEARRSIHNEKCVEVGNANMKPGYLSPTPDLTSYSVKASIMIRHSGFAVSNLEEREVFRLEMYNASFNLDFTPNMRTITLGLEQILMSNPAADVPLFFTNPEALQSVGTEVKADFQDDDLEFEDALEEPVKSLEIEIISQRFSNTTRNSINAKITEMEGNWQYSSIKLIFEALEEYKNILKYGLNTHKINVQNAGPDTENKDLIFLPDSAVAAVAGTFQTFKQRLGMASNGPAPKGQASGIGICDVVFNNELPTLYSEKSSKEFSSLIEIDLKGAAIVFCNAKNEVVARLSVSGITYKISKYENGESITSIEIGTGKLLFGGRCLLAHSDIGPLDEFEVKDGYRQGDESKKLMKIRIKSYDSHSLNVPYAMCVEGKIERIVCVYFQQDISRLMEYLDDGILSVFISKSYHKVVQTAASTYMLYSFSVTSPCFLFPENKAVLPINTELSVPPSSTLPNMPHKSVSNKNRNRKIISGDADVSRLIKRLKDEVDMWYFGSYLLFELGHLEFRNGYTQHSEQPKSTLFLKMLGTRASIIEQINGSRDVMGSVLDSTDLAVCYRSGGMMEIGIDSDAWVLKLTRMQLTFIIDVFNENLCGSGYKSRHATATNVATSAQSRYSLRMSLKRFQFDTLFSDTRPLAKFRFNYITVCLDYASNNVKMTSCYQFGLCGKTLTVDDERKDSVNAHRRLINCFVQHDSDSLISRESRKILEPSFEGLLQNWLKRYKRDAGHDFFSSASSADFYGVKCVVVSESQQTIVDCMVANAAIPLLCILAMDIGCYFSLSYSKSSMAMFPKMSPAISVPSPPLSDKTYTINLRVSNGKFIAFSKMNSTIFPQLELSSDFVLAMTLSGCSYNFLKIDILGCELARVYPLEGRRQVLCSNLEIYGNGQYVSDISSSKMFFNFVIPPFNLTLYTQDLSILLAAFGTLLTDGPSAAPPKRVIHATPDDSNAQGRFISACFNVKGIRVTFFDDMRKSLIPMMRLSVASDKIEYLNLPIEKRYSIIRCSSKLDYFNAAIGDWEPFLERCNCTLEYTNNIFAEKRAPDKKSSIISSEDVWKEFVPRKIIKITGLHNILINITPSLCQLLLWFVPMLSDNIQKGLVYENPALTKPDIKVYTEADSAIENSAYRYINLTGYEYYGFTLDTACENQNEAYSELKIITTTTRPLELDALVNKARRCPNINEPCIYLTARPPDYHVQTICQKFGIKNTEAVVRDLLVTRSVHQTQENFRHTNPETMPNVYSTPFENGTNAVMVPLSRDCSVSLMAPLKDATSFTARGKIENHHKEISESAIRNQTVQSMEQVLCEVKTPHPSHKLLVFTSTVRIYNRSGIPLLLCYLDLNLNPIYVANLKTRAAPISILDKSSMNKEFTESTVLQFSDAKIDLLRLQQDDFGYIMLLEHNHFASVPEWAFIGPAQAILSFIPAPLALDGNNVRTFDASTQFSAISTNIGNFKSSVAPQTKKLAKLANTTGWSKIIDSIRHTGTRVRQCYSPNMSESNFLYFVVSVVRKKSPFPANIEMREIVIYPSLSVMNTLPMELDICFTAKDHCLTDANVDFPQISKNTKKFSRMRTIKETATLLRRSIMHIYSVPPNETLSFIGKVSYTDFDSWSERVSKIYGASESSSTFELPIKNMAPLELELIRYPGGLPVSNTSFHGHLSLIINAPWWFIDRTGLGIRPQRRLPRPVLNGLSFLSVDDEDHPLYLTVNGRIPDSKNSQSGVRLPAVDGYSFAFVEDGGKKHAICLTTEKVSISGLSSHVSCRITSAIPEYLFTNNLKQDVFIRKDSRAQPIKVSQGTSIAVPWTSSRSMGNEETAVASLEFKPCDNSHWSSPVFPSEHFSGQTYMCLRQDKTSRPLVFCLSIVPKRGTKYCSISVPNSNTEGYVLINKCPYIRAAMVRAFHQSESGSSEPRDSEGSATRGSGVFFTAKYGQYVHFGWPQPFLHKSRLCQVLLWLDRNTIAPSKPIVINIGSPAFRYRQIEVTTPEYSKFHTLLISAENRGDYIAIEVRSCNPSPTSTVSASTSIDSRLSDYSEEKLLESKPTYEFSAEDIKNVKGSDLTLTESKDIDCGTQGKYDMSLQVAVQLSQIGLSFVSQNLHEELFFLEMSAVSFVGLCKGDHQRLELRISDIQIDNQLDVKHEENETSTILVNRGKVTGQKQQRHFLQIYVDRPFAGCKDLCLKRVFIVLDDMEVELSDMLLSRLCNFYKECMRSMRSWESGQKVDLRLIDEWLLKESENELSSLDNNPVSPMTLSLDYLYIERFNLVLWCSFELEKLHMLGDLMRMGLRILCVSRHFELTGAPLQFQQEYFCNSRGTIRSFYEQLRDKYLHSALSCIGSILGYSSLLNIPKLPITVGRNTIEFAADAVDSVSSGIGSLLSKFTFDNDYINKRQRERLNKPCNNMKEGIFSAGKSIGEGFMSLTNIVTKPIEGAQKEGMGGFIKGLGKGLAGSIVKPIDKVGQAVSHFSRGIKANMSKPLLCERWSVEPCRKPRMLWGEFSQVKPYSLSEAEIKQLLGAKLAKNIMHCETVSKQSHPPSYLAILFYPSKIYFVDLWKPKLAHKPAIIWKVHVASIEECRASSHGIIIRTKDGHCQVPCTDAELIHSIFTALEKARKQASSVVVIGPELFSQAYQ